MGPSLNSLFHGSFFNLWPLIIVMLSTWKSIPFQIGPWGAYPGFIHVSPICLNIQVPLPAAGLNVSVPQFEKSTWYFLKC